MHKYLIFSIISFLFSILCFSQKKLNPDKINSKVLLAKNGTYNGLIQMPSIKFCGKDSGYILIDSIKITRQLFIPSSYKLKSVSVYFAGTGWSNPNVGSLNSTDLGALNNLFIRCVEGTRIVFFNINITKDNKNIIIPDRSFIVKNKL